MRLWHKINLLDYGNLHKIRNARLGEDTRRCYDGDICIPEFETIFEYFGINAEDIEPKTTD